MRYKLDGLLEPLVLVVRSCIEFSTQVEARVGICMTSEDHGAN